MKTLIKTVLALLITILSTAVQAEETTTNNDALVKPCIEALNTIYKGLDTEQHFVYKSNRLNWEYPTHHQFFEFFEQDLSSNNTNPINENLLQQNKDLGVESINTGIAQAILTATEIYNEKRESLSNDLHAAAQLTAEIAKTHFEQHCANVTQTAEAIQTFQQTIASIPYQQYMAPAAKAEITVSKTVEDKNLSKAN